MMNGACIDMHAKKQVSVQIATAASEIVEAANCALDAVAIRNLMKEMGLEQLWRLPLYVCSSDR